MSDPAYPGQWRVKGGYIEQVAKMTHWEYPEAVERFGRQLKYDFEFAPGMTNPYIPADLLEKDLMFEEEKQQGGMLVEEPTEWRPYRSGGYLDDDFEELVGFNEDGDWSMLDEAEDMDEFEYEEDDEIWQA